MTELPAEARQRTGYVDTGWVRTFDETVNPQTSFDWTAVGWQSDRTPEARVVV